MTAGVTRVVLLRHVETTWSERGILQGTKDPPLDESGREMLPRVADTVAAVLRVPPRLVLSSPLRRATETAEAVAARIRYRSRVVIAEQLREVSFGDWEGHALTELLDDPSSRQLWEDFDPTRAWPGTTEDLASREELARVYLEDVIQANGQTGDVVVVSHGILIQALLARWILGDVRRVQTFDLAPGSVSVLRAADKTGGFIIEAIGIPTMSAG